MTNIFAGLSECQSHLQTIEHLIESIITNYESTLQLEQQGLLNEILQTTKTLSSIIDQLENELE